MPFFSSSNQGTALTPALVAELVQAPWVGNVRELRNFVERALVLGAERTKPQAASATPAKPSGVSEETALKVDIEVPFKDLRERWTDYLEREYLRGMLAKHKGNVSAVAAALGLDRSYVHRLLRKHELGG